MESIIKLSGELSAVVNRANGTVEDLGVISGPRMPTNPMAFSKPMGFWEKMWHRLRNDGKIPAAMGLAAFIASVIDAHLNGHASSAMPLMMGLVTTTGVNYLAADFASGGVSPHISGFNFHDTGTGGAHGGTSSISNATNATPIVVTSTAHGFTTNDIVLVASVGGNTNANNTWQITVSNANTFTLLGSTGNSAYTSGGTAQLVNGAGDTALTTPAGTSRVAGTQTTPGSVNVYKTVATINFTGSLTLTEFGLFSASSTGTLWDRRWFNTAGAPATTASAALVSSSIGVNNGDSVTYSYSLTCTQGGS